jgi:hypothetical protein
MIFKDTLRALNLYFSPGISSSELYMSANLVLYTVIDGEKYYIKGELAPMGRYGCNSFVRDLFINYYKSISRSEGNEIFPQFINCSAKSINSVDSVTEKFLKGKILEHYRFTINIGQIDKGSRSYAANEIAGISISKFENHKNSSELVKEYNPDYNSIPFFIEDLEIVMHRPNYTQDLGYHLPFEKFCEDNFGCIPLGPTNMPSLCGKNSYEYVLLASNYGCSQEAYIAFNVCRNLARDTAVAAIFYMFKDGDYKRISEILNDWSIYALSSVLAYYCVTNDGKSIGGYYSDTNTYRSFPIETSLEEIRDKCNNPLYLGVNSIFFCDNKSQQLYERYYEKTLHSSRHIERLKFLLEYDIKDLDKFMSEVEILVITSKELEKYV